MLTREQIADRAWELGAEHASNVVDVFIRNLRRKIDDPFPMPLLHTVRGVGYTLRAPEAAAAQEGARRAQLPQSEADVSGREGR